MKALADAGLQPQIRQIVDALALAYPKWVSVAALFNVLYSDDPNGGPDSGYRVIITRICHTRTAIRPLGWTVSKQGPGSSGRYRLQKIED